MLQDKLVSMLAPFGMFKKKKKSQKQTSQMAVF